jgi:hypothetical protein
MGIGFTIFLIVLAFSAGTVLGGLLGSGKREDLERQLAQVEAVSRKFIRAEKKRADKHKEIARGAAGRGREASELLYRLKQEIAAFLEGGGE